MLVAGGETNGRGKQGNLVLLRGAFLCIETSNTKGQNVDIGVEVLIITALRSKE